MIAGELPEQVWHPIKWRSFRESRTPNSSAHRTSICPELDSRGCGSGSELCSNSHIMVLFWEHLRQ